MARRLKAWCLKGLESECEDKRTHMFLTAVPPIDEVGSNAELEKSLQDLTAG